MTSLGLYLHIPFCRAKCAYCDFNSYAGLDSLHAPYLAALLREVARAGTFAAGDILGDTWALEGPEDETGLDGEASCTGKARAQVDSVYVGGGTPTVLGAESLVALLDCVRKHFALIDDAEISVEANPGTVDLDDLAALRRGGFNRLSLGAQSFDPGELRLLGRIHNAEQICQVMAWARQAGFENVNLDIIYGLPGQSVTAWRRNVESALALRPDHLSMYGLSLEEGTPLESKVECGDVIAPDPDTAADQYLAAEQILDSAGFRHYEISNWASSAATICRHNRKYWLVQPYLGFGAGAHSHLNGVRRSNVASPAEYVQRIRGGESPVAEQSSIDDREAMAETMILGLRLAEGVEAEAFAQRHGHPLWERYGRQLGDLEHDGLLELDGRGVRLTERGRLLGNRAFARFWPIE